ncbi:MAG: enolase C-terminal domain-like protein [Thermoanaerobaculia bacterium]
MTEISGFELFATDLPFRVAFKHSAAARTGSESLFLRCRLADGTEGWGESLPREYVTGESRDAAFERLAGTILPALVGRSFADLSAVEAFLAGCDGRAPRELVDPATPQTAAWCAVDLALLDSFGRAEGARPLAGESQHLPAGLRYSGVLSAETGWKKSLLLLLHRLLGFRAIKLKVGPETGAREIRRIRRWLGRGIELRADANMGWSFEQARTRMPEMARAGVVSFEEPIAADDLDGMSRLVAETGLELMADESFSTRESLDELVARRAATAVNARISKCGGLVATLARCREARAAGLVVQVGCQVGESSLLSAAHLRLTAAVGEVRFAEGCFGTLLLDEDPGRPEVRFHRGGRAPGSPGGPGLGVAIDRDCVARHSSRSLAIGRPDGSAAERGAA